MNRYEWADHSVNACPRYETGFSELLAAQPYFISSSMRQLYDSRSALIRTFQKIALELFRAALKNEVDPAILHWLINETPESLGLRFHRSLEDRHFTLPVVFRTDEVRPGRIAEINPPGALWGELQLAFEYAARMGYCAGESSPADQFATQITDLLTVTPIIHQFNDRSTSPACTRYFIEKTRPRLKYWMIDCGIKKSDCNFIRHSTFIELWSSDDLHSHLARVGDGICYDLPPHVLFDQKAPLALPFWSMTHQYFPDAVRDLFPYIMPLLPSGLELPDGTCVTIDEFSRWPRSRRCYYLKLAGFNHERNWGSKAVYRLSNMSSAACLDFLRQCLSGYERGEIWLLQQEEVQDDEITYLTRDDREHTQTMRTLFSGFYGPAGCIGVLALHGQHNKVHGSPSTVLSLVLAGP